MDFISSCTEHSSGPAGQLFTMLLQSILASPCNLSYFNNWPEDQGDYMNPSKTIYYSNFQEIRSFINRLKY